MQPVSSFLDIFTLCCSFTCFRTETMATISSLISVPIQSAKPKFSYMSPSRAIVYSEVPSTISLEPRKGRRVYAATAALPTPVFVTPKFNDLSTHFNDQMAKAEGGRREIRKQGEERETDPLVLANLYEIATAASDRAELHAILAQQRNNWNTLFQGSINSFILTATVLSSLCIPIISTLLFSASTLLLCLVNKIQPSQLAEEQRNAARLFKDLHTHIENTLRLHSSLRPDMNRFVDECVSKILAIDDEYPLPLLPGMREKFPKNVEPAVWWPNQKEGGEQGTEISMPNDRANNGWTEETEKEMKKVARILEKKDVSDYVRLSKLVLRVNRFLAVAGPVLAGLGAMGSVVGGPGFIVSAVCGAMAALVNTVEHGGQVGMVFEMYRNCGGFYKLTQRTIETALEEREYGRRENAELLEMKVALQLGRSLTSLRNLSESSEDFAGKLF